VRALADRFGVRPSKTFGQNFLTDPNLASAIAADAGAGPGVRVVEVGAGFGSLTLAVAATGAEVLAIEFDRAVVPALEEVVRDLPGVRVVAADVLDVDWAILGDGRWTMVSNVPYNIAVPVLMRMLEEAPGVSSYVVVVQRELADRLGAPPGSDAYGAVSVKIAYRADVATIRHVPREVFWPRPAIDSAVVRITPRPAPIEPHVDAHALFAVVDGAFGERRKTMTNAMRRLGLGSAAATGVLAEAGIEPSERPERLGLEAFARLTAALVREGVVGDP
jgi:16S rRNA (adenine1518-N6/adenine1519-N6)-dimethyltransferase